MKIRCFEVITIYKDKDIELPKRATANSAGYDIAAAEDFIVPARKIGLIPTGLKVFMQPNEVLLIALRSSVSIKHSVMIAQNVAVIDADYYNNPDNEGHFFIPILNYSDFPFEVKKGDRLAQGIFTTYCVTDSDHCEWGMPRQGGFGSTDEEKTD
jgi:dUTP pyrophosphatase